jgi:hypothetical protein
MSKQDSLRDMLWAAQDKLDKNLNWYSNRVARAMIHEIEKQRRRREWARRVVPRGKGLK